MSCNNILPYYSGGSLLEFEGGGSCQFVRLDTVDTPISQGAIVGFGDCGESVRSNVLLTSSSWQCLTSPGNVKILSGDIELTASNQSCECGDSPPITTKPPISPPSITTTTPPESEDGCRLITSRSSNGGRNVYPDRLIVAYRIIPTSLDAAPNITFGFRKNDSLLDGYQFNKELTNNSSYVEQTFQETRYRKANLTGWNIVALQGCPEDYDYCVQSDYTRRTGISFSAVNGNTTYLDDGPIWELVELYYNSNYNLQDLWTMNRWVGSNAVEKWLKRDKDIISGSMPEPINYYIDEDNEDYTLSYSYTFNRASTNFYSSVLEFPNTGSAAHAFLMDVEDHSSYIFSEQRQIQDKVNGITYSESRYKEIVLGVYDSQYWNITDAHNVRSSSLYSNNAYDVKSVGTPAAKDILVASDPDGSRTIDYFYNFGSHPEIDNIPAICRNVPWKDIESVHPRIYFPGLITYE